MRNLPSNSWGRRNFPGIPIEFNYGMLIELEKFKCKSSLITVICHDNIFYFDLVHDRIWVKLYFEPHFPHEQENDHYYKGIRATGRWLRFRHRWL